MECARYETGIRSDANYSNGLNLGRTGVNGHRLYECGGRTGFDAGFGTVIAVSES
jgi:hypothetical protein